MIIPVAKDANSVIPLSTICGAAAIMLSVIGPIISGRAVEIEDTREPAALRNPGSTSLMRTGSFSPITGAKFATTSPMPVSACSATGRMFRNVVSAEVVKASK